MADIDKSGTLSFLSLFYFYFVLLHLFLEIFSKKNEVKPLYIIHPFLFVVYMFNINPAVVKMVFLGRMAEWLIQQMESAQGVGLLSQYAMHAWVQIPLLSCKVILKTDLKIFFFPVARDFCCPRRYACCNHFGPFLFLM